MSCEELRDSYELYVLGVVEEADGAEIRAHLSRRCPVCEAGVAAARRLAALLSGAAQPAAPPARLRRRILASVGAEPRRYGWAAWAAVAALSVCAAIYVGARERQAQGETQRLRAEAVGLSSRIAGLNEAFAILNGTDTTEVSFGQGRPQPPRGKVFVNPARGVLLLASHLPPAPSGKTYEMWVIPKGGKPVPAGLFQAEADGTALHLRRGAIEVSATGAVAVTLENEGGAGQPTSQPLIVAALGPPSGSQ